MKRAGFFLAFLALASGSLLDGFKRQRRDAVLNTLEIRDLTGRSAEPYPDQLHLEIRTADGNVERMWVKRNIHFNGNIAVESHENGVRKRHVTEPLQVAEYLSKRAALHVKAERDLHQYRRNYSGLVYLGDYTYLVEPNHHHEKRNPDAHRFARLDTPPSSDYKVPDGVRLHDAIVPPEVNITGFRSQYRYKTGKNLLVDVLMIIDNGIYRKMSELFRDSNRSERERKTIDYVKRFYGVIWAGVAQKYAQVSYNGMTIMPRLSRILILKTRRDDDAIFKGTKSGTEVDSGAALMNVARWFQNERMYARYTDIDHCMMFTNNRMYSIDDRGKKSFAVVGLAYLGHVCKYWQSAIVEDNLTYMSIGTAAHELGHNLGAEHDGPPNSCNPHDSYQMAPWVTDGDSRTFGNQYKFSRCSLKSMYNNMQNLNRERKNCMTESAKQGHDEKAISDVVPGLKFDLNQQCQMLTGDRQSYYCGSESRLRDEACRKVQCSQRGRCGSVGRRHALHGTPCGQGMWCENGHCQRAPASFAGEINARIRVRRRV